MLTKLTIRNFKSFENVEIELGERVVFVGPNNSGKSSALQALALWSLGVRRWVEKRGTGTVPAERAGVTINRRDLVALPVPSANLLWKDTHVRTSIKGEGGKSKTQNIRIGVDVDGIGEDGVWHTSLEFDYANEESVYVRSSVSNDGGRVIVPESVAQIKVAYLTPMSGLAANEIRLDEGAIDVRIGEGKTAEVLRNLCWRVYESDPGRWAKIVERMRGLWGVTILDPTYVRERGEIVLSFRSARGVTLDLSASGRGQQQTLLLIAHLAANPNSVLLLDEPDAHLEFLRQREIYNVLADTAAETGSQVIIASHSEVILNEAADRDTVVAFVGKPHRIDDRGSQLLKSLKEIGFEQYLLAEESGWVLYLEGSTDLSILHAFASRLNHPALAHLERPFTKYVANQPRQAQAHFYGLREALPHLVGVAIYDRLDQALPMDPSLQQLMWRRREIENYLCDPDTLLSFAESQGRDIQGDLFASTWRARMQTTIEKISGALRTLGVDPWGAEIKASDEFLARIFEDFYNSAKLPNLMQKTDYHTLAPFIAAERIDAEVVEKLDVIASIASKATPTSGDSRIA